MNREEYCKFGYCALGPLLYGFSIWLKKQLMEKNISKVYFFSRDGLIMKKAFEIVNDQNKIETHYLEVSRRSLRVPTLSSNYSIDDLLSMLSPSNMIPLSSIFDAVGLDMMNYTSLLKKLELDENEEIYRKSFLTDNRIAVLLDSIHEDVVKNSKEEYDVLVKYLNQHNVNGNFAIVDIGWSGGMQRFLENTLDSLNIDHKITGFYTGVADYYKRNLKAKELDLNGYLFDFSHNSNDVDCRSAFVGLYEMLFLETKGSVKRYRLDADGSAYAERYPYEYCVEGILLPEVDLIRSIQEHALEYVKDAFLRKQELTVGEACRNLVKAGNKPTQKALNLFSKFHFYDEGVYSQLANPKSLFFYAIHIKQLKTDLYLSRWKTGFLRKLFKLPLPYYAIYKVLKGTQK